MIKREVIIKRTNLFLLLCIFILFIVYFSIRACRKGNNEYFTNQNLIDDDNYVKFYTKVFDQKEIFESNVNKITNYIDKSKYVKILNAGCGVGKHHELLYKKYRDVVGIDKSNSFIKWAKIRTPQGLFLVDDFNNTNLFPPAKFSHITCFLDTIYHNTEKQQQQIFKNFYFWLNDDGKLFINLFLKDKLDPAPREFSQYYYDENKTKHSLTYFDNFTHDAWWKGETYYEQYINKDGKFFIKKHSLNIPKLDTMLKYLNDTHFKVIDLIKYKDVDINDMVLCILTKNSEKK